MREQDTPLSHPHPPSSACCDAHPSIRHVRKYRDQICCNLAAHASSLLWKEEEEKKPRRSLIYIPPLKPCPTPSPKTLRRKVGSTSFKRRTKQSVLRGERSSSTQCLPTTIHTHCRRKRRKPKPTPAPVLMLTPTRMPVPMMMLQ